MQFLCKNVLEQVVQIAHSHVKTQLMGTNVERNVAATTMKFVTSTMGACRLVSNI